MNRAVLAIAVVVLLAGICQYGAACSLCPDPRSRLTLRQEAGMAKLVMFGTLSNGKLNANGQGGTTDFAVERVIKDDAVRANRNSLTLPRFVPSDPKNPPHFLIFCDVYDGKLDPYRGNPVKSADVVPYLLGQLAIDPKDRVKQLLYSFNHLDAADPEVASDAFTELAKASDTEIALCFGRFNAGNVQKPLNNKELPVEKFDAEKVRKLLTDPKTPSERLGLYAFLLAAGGKDADADLLLKMLREPTEQTKPAFSGLLAGLIQLRPKQGWQFAHDILGDAKKPFGDRYAAVNALKFLHNCRPAETKDEVLKGFRLLLPQADAADLALEDLRRNEWWEATADVLDVAGRKSHDTPLLRRSLLRYALSCPKPEAAAWVAGVRKMDPETVKDVEEALSFEKEPVLKPTSSPGR